MDLHKSTPPSYRERARARVRARLFLAVTQEKRA
jgi:hypothetical protein